MICSSEKLSSTWAPRVLSLHNTFSLELPPFFRAYVLFTRQNSLSIKLLVSKKYTVREAHIYHTDCVLP